MLFPNQQRTAYHVGLSGSVEQALSVPGVVKVKSNPFYSCKFYIIYIDLMCYHPFSTLPVAISGQCCIDNENFHNTNHYMCLSCVRDDMLNF